MVRVGVRELRQNASAVLAVVEQGEQVTITVQGRDAAVLAPVPRSSWVSADRARSVYDAPVDERWAQEISADRHDEERPTDPWSRR
jgi:prevent-host-death family protein